MDKDLYEIPICVFGALLIITVVLPLLIMFFSTTTTSKMVVKEDIFTPIVALSLSSSQEKGNFFLGTGNISGESYYYFYVKDNNKYRLNKVKAEETDIVEDSNPRVEKKTTVKMNKNTPGGLERFLGVSVTDTNWAEEPISLFSEQTVVEEYTLYIPKGSIKEEFSADLSKLN